MKNIAKQDLCRTKRHLLALCVGMLGTAGLASANQDVVAQDGAIRLENVQIRDDSQVEFEVERVYTEPGSAVYVPLKTVERFRGSSPGDILKGVVGVQVSDNRNGNALDVGIRGIQGQNRTPVTVDGGIQSIDVYRGTAGIQQRSYIDPDLISSIRVEKGPSMNVNAGGAIGGMVEMQTLVPEDILVKGESHGARVRLTTANNSIKQQVTEEHKVFNRKNADRPNFYEASDYSGSVAYAVKKDNFSLLGAYVQRNSGNYFGGKHGFDRFKNVKSGGAGDPTTEASVTEFYKQHEEVLDTHNKTKSLLLKGTWQPTDEHRVEAGYRLYDSTFGEIMPSQISRVPVYGKADLDAKMAAMYYYEKQKIGKEQWAYVGGEMVELVDKIDEHGNPFMEPSDKMIQHDPGKMKVHAFNLGYSWQPSKYDWINLKANLWATRALGDMFNSNPDNKPFYRYTQNQNLAAPDAPDYKKASQISTKNDRIGLNLSNSSRFDTRVGELVYNYSFDYQYERMQPGKNSPIVVHDLRANRYVRNAKRQSFNLALSQEWRPVDRLSIDLGLRWTQASVHDNNREAIATAWTEKTNILLAVNSNPSTQENILIKWQADAIEKKLPKFNDDYTKVIGFTDVPAKFTIEGLKNTLYRSDEVQNVFDVDQLVANNVKASYISDKKGEIEWHNLDDIPKTVKGMEKADPRYQTFTEKHATDWTFVDQKRQHGQVWSPHFGLSWRWGEDGIAYLKYAQAMRLPGMAETTLGNITSPGSNTLKPERSNSLELGVGKLFRNLLTADDQAGIKLAFFDTKVKNFITRRATIATAGNPQEFSHYNVDSFNVRGYELQANYDSGRIFADLSANYQAKVQTCDAGIAQQFRDHGTNAIEWVSGDSEENKAVRKLKASYMSTPNCIDGGFGGAFVNAQNPPRYTINLTLGGRFFDKRLTVGTRVIKTSKPLAKLDRIWHTYANSGLQKYYLSALVFDAFAEWKINDKAELGLTINNLTDQYYTDPMIMSLMPAPGRTIRLNLNWKF